VISVCYQVELRSVGYRIRSDGKLAVARLEWKPLMKVSSQGGFTPLAFADVDEARAGRGLPSWGATRIVRVTVEGKRRIVG
jgi:hypothetical protein